MRGQQQVRGAEDGVVGDEGLAVVHVERGTAEPPGAQRGQQRRRVDDGAARDVDDDRVGFHRREGRCVQQATCLVVQRAAQHHHVGLCEQRRLVGRGDARGQAGRAACQAQHLHAHGGTDAADLSPDRADTDDAEHAAAQLTAGVGKRARLRPAVAAQPGIERGQAAPQLQHRGEAVLDDRGRVRARQVRYRDAAGGGRGHRDQVEPHAVAHDHAQLRCVLEDIRREFVPHDQRVDIGDQPRDRGGGGIGRDHHVAVFVELLAHGRVDLVRQQDLGAFAHSVSRKGGPATTGLLRRPKPWTSTVTTWPARSQASGRCNAATPAGVPVAITSPGSSGMRCEM